MQRQLFKDNDLDRIYQSAVRVLGAMGMKVENRECLEAMERFGCKIDYPNERALFAPEVIDRVLAMVHADQPGWQRGFSGLSPELIAARSGTCPFYYDAEAGRRRATEADCIRMFKLAEASGVPNVPPLVSNGDCAPKFEAIRCLQLGIETLNRSVAQPTDLFYPEQVPFVVELGKLYKNDPAWFLPCGNCPTSPLAVGKTIADLAVAKAPYKRFYAVPAMPVSGANAPMTPVGTAVIGVAEILGGFVLAKALNPETPVGACVLTGLMDMRAGSMVFVAPEVFTADTAVVETMECRLHVPCEAYGVYIDAKLPGMRAVFEKLMRCAGLGLYCNLTGMDGSLDQGKCFSPTQMILDHDMHRFVSAFTGKPVVDDDALAVDAILDIQWEGSGYLTHDHTVRHMREAWQSMIYGRSHWVSLKNEQAKEREYLRRAEQTWHDRLAKYVPPDHPADFLKELRKICQRAKRALI